MKEAFANEQTRLHEERLKEEAEAERLAQVARDNERSQQSVRTA
jgi:hypothetical protein